MKKKSIFALLVLTSLFFINGCSAAAPPYPEIYPPKSIEDYSAKQINNFIDPVGIMEAKPLGQNIENLVLGDADGHEMTALRKQYKNTKYAIDSSTVYERNYAIDRKYNDTDTGFFSSIILTGLFFADNETNIVKAVIFQTYPDVDLGSFCEWYKRYYEAFSKKFGQCITIQVTDKDGNVEKDVSYDKILNYIDSGKIGSYESVFCLDDLVIDLSGTIIDRKTFRANTAFFHIDP